MLDKKTLIQILNEVYKRSHSDEISNIIKQATLNLDIKKLTETMINLYKNIIEEMGFDSFEGLMDCFEAIDYYINDQEIVDIVLSIRKKFNQE